MQRLSLLFASLCPPGQLAMLDTWWLSPRGKLRADLGVYDRTALPDAGRVFKVPPRATVEVLSDDALHDLTRKDGVCAEAGARRAYIDPYARTS